jgi:hypothetical protein
MDDFQVRAIWSLRARHEKVILIRAPLPAGYRIDQNPEQENPVA